MPDHDQLMKLLGMAFPTQLFSLFFILRSRLRDLPNPLAPAMVSMMRIPEDEKARVRYEAARRIATDETTPRQKHLLFCCLERYLTLSDEQQAEHDRLVRENQAPEVQEMAVTTYEKGMAAGVEQGIERGIE